MSKEKVQYKGTLPVKATQGSSGFDLKASYGGTLEPGERTIVPTGLSISLREGLEAQVRPRSGLAYGYGVTVLNTPGTIDSDYIGEVGVILINLGKELFTWKAGERIAQLVITPVVSPEWELVDELEDAERGEGGFGSSGTT